MKKINTLNKIQILLFNKNIYRPIGKLLYFKIAIFVFLDVFLLGLIGNILTNIKLIESILNLSNVSHLQYFFGDINRNQVIKFIL